MTLQADVETFIELRDYIDDQQKQLDDAMAPYKEAMVKLQNKLLELMNKEKVDNIKTARGTAYRTTRTSVTVRDWEACLSYITSNQAWHMLERRVSKVAAEEFLEENKRPLPGCDISRALVVQIRRS